MELNALLKTGPRTDIGETSKVKDTKSAAREFEALLIGQLMQSAFSPEQMGLGGEMDSGGQTMLDFGREHLARVIAEGGGLGLGKLIESGLAKGDKNAAALLKR
ncbi:MAG: hypothetical protein JNM66_33940 [Bryobacterales bacterium]|nr:hypothetical protein [Bryobacterales bacterium]